MADTERSRHTERMVTAVTSTVDKLSDGWLRHELLVAALVLSVCTLMMGLIADHLGWKIGYCVVGTAAIGASVVVLRRGGPRQWLASLGIAVANVVLLIVYGRLSGGL